MFNATTVDNPVVKIQLYFKDGSTETIKQGFVGQLNQGRMRLQFTGMSDEELTAYLLALSDFSVRLIQAIETERVKEEQHGKNSEVKSGGTSGGLSETTP